MYLVDTNVWLERLLGQTRSEEARQFLERISSERLFITDFTFHSIGVILSRLYNGAGHVPGTDFLLNRAAVFKIGGDAGCSEGVAAGRVGERGHIGSIIAGKA